MLTTRDARRAALVVNTASRRGAGAYAEARRRLADHGLPLTTSIAVDVPNRLHAVVRDLAETGHDLVVVGGGDGTLATAADALAGTGTTMAVLPTGTANDFARTLSVPLDVATACSAIASGRVVDVDLGRIDGRPFLNVASVGLSVEATRRLSPALKRRLGSAAYGVAVAGAYRHHRPFAARLEFPDGDHDALDLDDLLQVTIANGRHHGGGVTVSPDASLDDDVLDVYAIRRAPLHRQLGVAARWRTGRHVAHEAVVHLTTRAIRLGTDAPLPVNVDGEVSHRTPVDLEVERAGLEVVVPTGATFARRGRRGLAIHHAGVLAPLDG